MSFIINPYSHDAQALIGPNTGLHLELTNLSTMLREGPIPLTTATADGQAIGLLYDQSINGLIIKQTTDANKPILGSDGTRNSYLTFDGTNDNLTIASSLSFFNTFWQAVPKGTILTWIKFNGGDGTSMGIMNSWGTVATNPGINFIRASTNKILVRAGDGTIRWTYTSTTDINVAAGWVGIIVSINGTGASAGRFILMDSGGTILEDNTFSVSAGSTINAFSNMNIGMRSSDLYLNGSISTIIVENFPVSDALIEQFRNYNPARITTEFPAIGQWLLDMNNSAFIFSDAALSVPVVADDVVRGMRQQIIGNFNITPAFGALRRQVSSTSDATSAIYKTNVINGNAVIRFDGTDDNYSFTAIGLGGFLFEEVGGKWTCFFVAKNDDATFGSHLMRGNNYFVLTGSGYSGASPPTTINPYAVMHPDPVGTSVHTNTKGAGVDDFKVIAFRRHGTEICAWNGNKVKSTSSSSSVFSINDMGLAHASPGADWNFDGDLAFFSKYNGVMTDSQVEAEIDRLNARFGL